MTVKFDEFMKALEDLCIEHEVLIYPSAGGKICIDNPPQKFDKDHCAAFDVLEFEDETKWDKT